MRWTNEGGIRKLLVSLTFSPFLPPVLQIVRDALELTVARCSSIQSEEESEEWTVGKQYVRAAQFGREIGDCSRFCEFPFNRTADNATDWKDCMIAAAGEQTIEADLVECVVSCRFG